MCLNDTTAYLLLIHPDFIVLEKFDTSLVCRRNLINYYNRFTLIITSTGLRMLRTAFLSTLIFFAGCAPLQRDKYTFSEGDFSEITFETDAPNWMVDVDISTSEKDCDGFRSAGTLFYDAQLRGGGFFGALQKINPIRPNENVTLTQRVPTNSVIQIQASATTTGAGIYGRCGPITTKFKTNDIGNFKVHVGLKNGYCFLTVTDLAKDSRTGAPLQCK